MDWEGLRVFESVRWFVFLLCAPAMAAPVLRFPTNALVWYPGQATTLPMCATNAGDGALMLSAKVQTGVQWLAVAVDAAQCVQFTLDIASLTAGTYTATVTFSDPHAIDAPQVVTITALVGGGDPAAIDRYSAPGMVSSTQFYTGDTSYTSRPSLTTHTQDGGNWLAVTFYPFGTLGQFYQNGYISLSPPAGMASGTYTGSVTLNDYVARTIPVTMRVTTQPIAVPSVNQIQLRLAQGGPSAAYPFLPAISFTNAGMGTLAVQAASAAGTGLSAAVQGGQVVVTVDPMSRAPGIYNDGLVTIQCNGANCPVQVPVSLEVIPRADPTITYLSVVDNAVYLTPVTPGDVCILQGEQLSLQASASAEGFPLPASLGGVTVLVNDVEAPLYYTSFGQIAFQMPYSTAAGTAQVQVIRDGLPGNTVTVKVSLYEPRIVVITDALYQLRDATHPTIAGETLIIWAIGLGATNPPVDTGAAAPLSPPAVTVKTPVVSGWGGAAASFSGLSGGSAGLYQVIVTVPDGLAKGIAYVGLGGNVIPLLVQ